MQLTDHPLLAGPPPAPPAAPPETAPLETAPLETPPPVDQERKRPTALIALAATVTAIAVAFGGLWVAAQGDLADARKKIAEFEAADAARAAAEAARPDLAQLITKHGLTSYREGTATRDSAALNFYGFSTSWKSDLQDLLDELGFNASAVISRMGNTRALDGTQSAEGDNVQATWTYHPDDGLDVVLEVED